MKIAILGAGAFGTALGSVLAEGGFDIDYYDTRIEKEKLSDVIRGSSYILICVPSASIGHVLPHLPKNIPLIIATKGILTANIFRDFPDYMVLSGPGFASDIKNHQETHLTATDERIKDLFERDYLTFELTTDKAGVLMCGALKNVYAILAGIEGLEPETMEREKFIEDVANEMRDILKLNGADKKTVDLECGIGDLRLTCALPSRNYEFGRQIRDQKIFTTDKTVEGISALKKIKRGEIKIPDSAKKLKFLIGISKEWA